MACVRWTRAEFDELRPMPILSADPTVRKTDLFALAADACRARRGLYDNAAEADLAKVGLVGLLANTMSTKAFP